MKEIMAFAFAALLWLAIALIVALVVITMMRGSMNSALVEFQSDRYQVVTSRNYLRKAKAHEPNPS